LQFILKILAFEVQRESFCIVFEYSAFHSISSLLKEVSCFEEQDALFFMKFVLLVVD